MRGNPLMLQNYVKYHSLFYSFLFISLSGGSFVISIPSEISFAVLYSLSLNNIPCIYLLRAEVCFSACAL